MFIIRRKKLYFKPHSKRVDFILGGTQKAGTTALYHYLRKHPQIGMAQSKELHFFNNEITFAKPYILYSRYEKHFDFASNAKVFGEATPSYIYWENTPRRIWEYNPDMKLIFILRNPIDRAFSQWNMEVDRGNEHLSFWEAIKKERVRNLKTPFLYDRYSYIIKGMYAEQIRRYQRYFPDNQMLFIKYEDFKVRQKESLKRIFQFLQVDPDLFDFEYKTIHRRPKHHEMTPAEHSYLVDIYRYNIKEVEKILGWDCSDWLSTKLSPA